MKERSSTPLPSPCTLSRRIALRRACFVNVSPLEFGKSNRPRPYGGSGSGRAGPAKWASKEARSSFCTSLSHNLTWNPPPFCLVTASALLGQYRGEPFPGATHTPASIARSRRTKCETVQVLIGSKSGIGSEILGILDSKNASKPLIVNVFGSFPLLLFSRNRPISS